MARKTKKLKNRAGWNLFLHRFDAKEQFEVVPKFFFTIDWWKYSDSRKSPPEFDYSYKGFTLRISISFLSKKTWEFNWIDNQKEYLKYLKQEWPGYGQKYWIQWALRR